MGTLKRIIALLLRRELVWLQDHDGEVVLRIARRTPFGLECYRHPPGGGRCLLFPDGSFKGPSYVDAWKPHNVEVSGKPPRGAAGAR